jgi:hypothetical protein
VTCEYVVQRAAANLPQSTTETLFEVSGGNVLILGIIGTITTGLELLANTATVAIGDVTVLSGTFEDVAAGDLASGTPTAITTDETVSPPTKLPLISAAGTVVSLQCSASITGQVRWTLWYRPLDPGAVVAAV